MSDNLWEGCRGRLLTGGNRKKRGNRTERFGGKSGCGWEAGGVCSSVDSNIKVWHVKRKTKRPSKTKH